MSQLDMHKQCILRQLRVIVDPNALQTILRLTPIVHLHVSINPTQKVVTRDTLHGQSACLSVAHAVALCSGVVDPELRRHALKALLVPVHALNELPFHLGRDRTDIVCFSFFAAF